MLFGGDADASVDHLESNDRCFMRLFRQDGAHHHRAGAGEPDRVVDQVQEDLSQAAWVASQTPRHVRSDGAGDLESLAVCLLIHEGRGVFDDIAQVEVVDVQVELAGFDLREVQDVIDYAEQHRAGPLQRLGVFQLVGGEVCAEEKVGHPDHAVHRRAQLVADHRDEFVLHAVHFASLSDVADNATEERFFSPRPGGKRQLQREFGLVFAQPVLIDRLADELAWVRQLRPLERGLEGVSVSLRQEQC